MNKFVLAFLAFLGGLSLLGNASTLFLSPDSQPVPFPIWVHEPISSGGDLADLELDSDNNPHILFLNPTTEMLRYAYLIGGAWMFEDLAPFPIAAPPADLAFDLAINPPDGTPRVAYVDAEDERLYFGRPDSGGWKWESLDAHGRLLSMRIDPAGAVHLVIVDGQQIIYLSQSGETWVSETIGQPDPFKWNLFMDLDAAGEPHVAGTGANGSFHAKHTPESGWVVEPLALANVEGFALGPDGTPHYLITEAEELWGRPPFSRVTLSLTYPSLDPSVWDVYPLWTADDWYVDADMAIAGDGTVHVVFRDINGRPQYLALKSLVGLTHEHPASGGTGHISLKLDSDGKPRLAQHDGNDLLYSRREVIYLTEFIYLPVELR